MTEPKRALFPFLVLLCLCSCTVLEDRSSCPCTLSLVPLSFSGRVYIMLDAPDGFLREECVEELDGESFRVPRQMLRCCVVQGAEPGPEGSWLIPQGEDCPEIRVHRSRIDARRAAVTDTVMLHKYFCVMDICIDPSGPGGVGRVQVRSSTAGYDRYGGSLRGVFCHSPSQLGGGSFRLRLPRQLSSDLELEVEFISGSRALFPLGVYLDSMGYDWSAEDLEDVSIGIDSRSSTVSIITSAWKKTLSFDLRI